MSAHTPGPWRVGGPYPGVSVCSVTEEGIWEPVVVVDHRTNGEQDPQALADARLIAAAPELLEALRKCLEYIPGSEVRSWPPGFRLKKEALEAARAAIAKVEGR